MERTRHNNFPDTNKLPDAIHRCNNNEGFTQIPNSMIRSKELSWAAKGILTILFSNQDGWKSSLKEIASKSKECEKTICNKTKELQKKRYLKIITYRDSKTKQIKGCFWAVTDTPGKFDFHKNAAILKNMGFEIMPMQRTDNQPYCKKPYCGFLHSNNIIIKKEENSECLEDTHIKNNKHTFQRNSNNTSIDKKEYTCLSSYKVFGQDFDSNHGCIECEEKNPILYYHCKIAYQNSK